MARVMGASSLASGVDRIEAGLREGRSDISFEATKRLAELPFGDL